MRLLMLSWEYPPRIIGGIARHVYDLSWGLARAGTGVDVITPQHPGAPELEEFDNLSVHRVSVGVDQSNILRWVDRFNRAVEAKAESLLTQHGAEDVLIHPHDWLAQPAAKALKHRHHIPIVATVHATEHGRNYGIHTDLQRDIAHMEWEVTYEAWRVIVCSHFMKGEVSRILSVPPDKIDVIHNGVDVSKFEINFDRKEFREQYARDGQEIIFFVGRMAQEKGAHVLIDAFRRLSNEGLDAKFVIAGGGDRTALKKQAEHLGQCDSVYFTGYIDDETLLKLYKVADVAVFPSLYEPFGIVALEAMAAGVPVVVSDAGGLREVVDHGVTGFVTWAGNAESPAWGIAQVLRNPDASRWMAETAYVKARDIFNWDRIAAQTAAVYDGILAEHRARAWEPEPGDADE